MHSTFAKAPESCGSVEPSWACSKVPQTHGTVTHFTGEDSGCSGVCIRIDSCTFPHSLHSSLSPSRSAFRDFTLVPVAMCLIGEHTSAVPDKSSGPVQEPQEEEKSIRVTLRFPRTPKLCWEFVDMLAGCVYVYPSMTAYSNNLTNAKISY